MIKLMTGISPIDAKPEARPIGFIVKGEAFYKIPF